MGTKMIAKAKANALINANLAREMAQDLCSVLDYFGLENNLDIAEKDIVIPSMNAKSFYWNIFRNHPNYIGKGRIMIDVVLERTVDLEIWTDCILWLKKQSRLAALNAELGSYHYIPFLDTIDRYVNHHRNDKNNYITDEYDIKEINSYAEDCNLKVRARANQKFTKVISSFAKEIGLDKIIDIRDASYTDNNGVFHKQQKDFGWKKVQAEIGDALNFIEVPSPMIVSVNTKDIATMSCGDSWASCHFIGAGEEWKGNDSYQGCYSGGNIGYMLDTVSFICFTIKQGTDVEDWEKGKTHRAMFAYENGVLYEGRVYPDGRDGGDSSNSSKMRNVVQKIIADGLNENNVWTLKKGVKYTREYVHAADGYIGYNDWTCCEDGNMSFLQSENTDMDHVIYVGTSTICPNCGKKHLNSKCVLCDKCWNNYDTYCESCNTGISFDNYSSYYEIEGHYYCCRQCASNEGYHLCVDDDEFHHASECSYDSWEDEWYYYDDDSDCVRTNDGNWYRDEDNAFSDGYRYAKDKEQWLYKDVVYRDDYDSCYYYDESEKVTIGGSTYHNMENAIADGWTEEAIEREVG